MTRSPAPFLLTALVLGACSGRTPGRHLVAEVEQLTISARSLQRRLLLSAKERDELGPGEYRERLRAATSLASGALALEHEARAAAALATNWHLVASLDQAERERLIQVLPVSVAPLLAQGVAMVAAGAAELARRAQARRRRSREAAAELAELRRRVLDLRAKLGRLRIEIAQQLSRSGGDSLSRQLIPAARAHQVRLTTLRRVGDADDTFVRRVTIEVGAEGRFQQLAGFGADVGTLPGTTLERMQVTDGGKRASVRLVRQRPSPGANPLPELRPSSTPSLLLLRLQDATEWHRRLVNHAGQARLPELLLAITRSLVPGAQIDSALISARRFRLVAVTRKPAAASFLKRLAAEPGVASVRTARTGRRLALEARWKPGADYEDPLVAQVSAPEPTRAQRPKTAKRTTAPSPPLPEGPPPRWTLAGVVSSGANNVRALVRDPGGKPTIVKIGSLLSTGARVTEIGRNYVLAKNGPYWMRIVTP